MKKSAQTSAPHKTIVRRALLLLVVFVCAGAVAWPQGTNWVIDRFNDVVKTKVSHVNFPLVLGLDLQGGTQLEYSADLSKIAEVDKPSAMDGVRDVIERRVNSLGVSEPVVRSAKAGNDWRLSVELAGIRDVNEAIKAIGETPTLDFRIENPDAGRSLTADEQKQLDAKNADIKKKAEDALAAVKKGASLEDLAKQQSEDPSKDKGGDLGFLLDQTAYSQLYAKVRDLPAGKLSDTVIEDTNNLYVAQVLETKDAGQEIHAAHLLIQWAGARESASTSTKDEARKRIEAIKAQVTPENFDAMAKKYSEEPGADKTGGDLDWFRKGDMVQAFSDAAFALKKGEVSAPVETEFGFHLIHKIDERPLNDVRVRVIAFKKALASDFVNAEPWKKTDLTGKNLKRAQLDFDQRTGESQVALQFDDEGAKKFAKLTKDNVGKTLGIFLDDQPISTPRVNQEITGGQAVINGTFTINEAKQLAQRLQAGALPVPISIISQQTVGPTLGGESVNASLRAGLFGFLFVALFMLVLYRLPGLMSVVSLTFYSAVLLALFKLIPVTLTLAGIAGFILSMGIAVDANVLIYERLKEELRSGKSMALALDEAFKRAWPSIRDGNATTLIAAAVLYGFSSSIIRGFALTLGLGVVLSMFCGMVVTRILLKLVTRPGFVEKVPWLFLDKKRSS